MTTTTTYTCAAEQGVDTFLQHYIAPILKENDELRKEILELKKDIGMMNLMSKHMEECSHYYVGVCGDCGNITCSDCNTKYNGICSECGKFYCGDCKHDIIVENLCKNCTRVEK